jgi:hypothetical protein
MKVLDGSLNETQYSWPKQELVEAPQNPTAFSEGKYCYMEPQNGMQVKQKQEYQRDQVAYIHGMPPPFNSFIMY